MSVQNQGVNLGEKPKVTCPICGAVLAKSSLSGHLTRSHNYYRRPRKNNEVITPPSSSVTSQQSSLTPSSQDVVLESEPEQLIIARTERKRNKRGVKKLKGRVESESVSESVSESESKAEGKARAEYKTDWGKTIVTGVGGGLIAGLTVIAILEELEKRGILRLR